MESDGKAESFLTSGSFACLQEKRRHTNGGAGIQDAEQETDLRREVKYVGNVILRLHGAAMLATLAEHGI